MTALSLSENAEIILKTHNPFKKCFLTFKTINKWKKKQINIVGKNFCIEEPYRLNKPIILPPKFMPRRRGLNKINARIALIHSLAHIELNAIDLAWDIIARFNHYKLPLKFYDDWMRIAKEEAIHFLLLTKRLKDLGSRYGELDAHDGLWDAAKKTNQSLIERLAVVPMYFEARGLDVSPDIIEKLSKVKDHKSVKCLEKIYKDEINHVKIAEFWFRWVCEKFGKNPKITWQTTISSFFCKRVDLPKNNKAREKANMSAYLSYNS
ncbi:MAG: rhamnosyltransferase [Rhodospirillaceae bacterium]|nr:rhamnosyltransferase [Rhodospirillaceae bacterium]|tara:strand:+ start:924 stop:1718 length:795 start_codon:yes stop_codon:yes gene_type:complete